MRILVVGKVRAARARADGYYLSPTDGESLRRGNILRWDSPPE